MLALGVLDGLILLLKLLLFLLEFLKLFSVHFCSYVFYVDYKLLFLGQRLRIMGSSDFEAQISTIIHH